jgi:polysaccharide biosynthesis protein PslH
MRILYFSSRECWPLNTGARLRDYHQAHQLAQQADVSYLGLRMHNDPPVEPIPASSRIRSQEIVEKDPSFSASKLIRGFIGPVPVTLLNCVTPLATAALTRILTSTEFDSLQLEGVHLLPYISTIRRLSPETAIVCDWHNVESEIMRRFAGNTPSFPKRVYASRTAALIENMEVRLLRECDSHSVASGRERERLLAREPKADITTIGNGVDVAFHTDEAIAAASQGSSPGTGNLLFVGSMDYHANVDGAVEFANQVWPVLRAQPAFSQRKFIVVGRKPTAEVLALGQQPGVEVTGTVPDVRAYYRDALAMVVLLRVGSGTRLKILEAMASGVPVVSTRLGAEGIDVTPGTDILFAETPQEFSLALRSLVEDKELRERLIAGARRLVSAEYDWPILGRRLFEVHQRAAKRIRNA